MPVQWTSNYHFNAPVDAAAVAVTPSSSDGADSGWVTVFTADADCVLTKVIVHDPGVAARFRVDVGISVGGGAESVIASTCGVVVSGTTLGWGPLDFVIPIDAIPSGAVVKVRMAKNGTSTVAWNFALQYYKKPIVGNLLTTANPQLISTIFPMPTVASATTPAWTNSGWATIFTPANDSVITGYIHNFVANSEDYIFDFGQSSTPLWTVKDRQGLSDYTLYRPIKHPFMVTGGSAVQGRIRKVGTTARNFPVAVTYIELPL